MVIQSCVLFWSLVNGIHPDITNAVIKVESRGNVMATGRSHQERGLMQIREKFVPETSLQLYNPCTNIMVGTRLLREAKRNCKHFIESSWLVCFNVGQYGARKIKHPRKFPYYTKVMKELE